MDFYSWNPFAEKDFEFYDTRLVDEVTSGNKETFLFFRLLALCHTVMPEINDDGRILSRCLNDDGRILEDV